MATVIVPACGMSSRFPGTKPKYLLSDYKGKLMLEGAVEPFMEDNAIVIVILQEHEDKYNIAEYFKDRNFKFVILPNKTKGPADTVAQAIKLGNITGPILIKDCDSFFDDSFSDMSNGKVLGNFICVEKITNKTKNAPSKSYVITDNQGIVSSIVEKQIVSDTYCVGGYKFNSADDFLHHFKWLKIDREVYVSDVIESMISAGHVFSTMRPANYVDVGTKEDWIAYNNKQTIICDIDGTIIQSQSRFPTEKGRHLGDKPEPLVRNVATLLAHQARGCQLIFITARRRNWMPQTRQLLDDLGFKDYVLIMEAHHSQRVLINDCSEYNPYPAAREINIQTGDDLLGLKFPT